MTEEHQLRIPYRDLKYVSIECPCGTEITLDLSPKKTEVEWENKALRCTFCTQPFDSNLKSALANLAHWYMLVEDSGTGDRVFFTVKKTA